MKKHLYLFFLIGLFFSHCEQPGMEPLAFNIAGSYQLLEYNTATASDTNPSGAISITQTDKQHVNVAVKGVSGKMKITYSYQGVVVTSGGQNNTGQYTYQLAYKGHQIGEAGNDGVVRYVNLSPSAKVILKAEEF